MEITITVKMAAIDEGNLRYHQVLKKTVFGLRKVTTIRYKYEIHQLQVKILGHISVEKHNWCGEADLTRERNLKVQHAMFLP